MDLTEAMLSPENLNLAWRTLRHDKATWLPGLSRTEMERHALRHLLTLRDEIAAGRYRPAPVRRFTLITRSGKARELAALQLRDKLAQRAALQVLTPLFEKRFHPDSYGYRPGRNREMAVARLRTFILDARPFVLLTDIRDCFDSIPLRPLISQLPHWVPDRKMVRLLTLWIQAWATRKRWFGRSTGLPQGGILSPLLCNLYLTSLDDWLTRKRIAFVRFGDDIAMTFASGGARRRGQKKLDKQLQRLGLSPGIKREREYAPGQPFEYLGMTVRCRGVQAA